MEAGEVGEATVTREALDEATGVQGALEELSREARELYLGGLPGPGGVHQARVPEVSSPPSALQFLRRHVSPSLPLVVRGGCAHWPAVTSWSPAALRAALPDTQITVAVTPTGLADAALGEQFVMPEERRMAMAAFLDLLEEPVEGEVYYVQRQNSNLTEELGGLLGDVAELPWASEAFDRRPDATNFWMGDERAVTSMHKDPYENIYCVVRGHKDILLQPPTDLPWIPYRDLTPAVYKQEGGVWSTHPTGDPPLPWVAVDPLRPDLASFPLYANSTQLRCRLGPGDTLYLPALWFHHLQQSQGCIAVNFWYDMEFDVKYNYFNLLNNIKKTVSNKL